MKRFPFFPSCPAGSGFVESSRSFVDGLQAAGIAACARVSAPAGEWHEVAAPEAAAA